MDVVRVTTGWLRSYARGCKRGVFLPFVYDGIENAPTGEEEFRYKMIIRTQFVLCVMFSVMVAYAVLQGLGYALVPDNWNPLG